uniref:Reverse transcriptase domain-containing protein n=1 Tax=Xenopus tropicalis TaxID=8364 RepID=A0A803J9H5_XENTR
MKKRFYDHGNKCSKLLARMLKTKESKNHIFKMKQPNGQITSSPKDIQKIITECYRQLYQINQDTNIAHKTTATQYIEYLNSSDMNKGDQEWIQTLEQDISNTELEQAIKNASSGKCPGPDGFSMLFFKTLKPYITTALTKAFNEIKHGHLWSLTSLEAHISLIPKKGKDPASPSSYRPISLINNDIKLLANILSTRLKPGLSQIIHTDQAGFLPRRETRDNLNKLLNIIISAEHTNTPLFLLSTDAEKAFDRVRWDFMFHCLRYIGLGPNILKWITSLYSNPTARLKINNSLSDHISLKNGTRQGCPLSPLLFVLSLTQPLISLPNLLKEINKYNQLSDFKINNDKSSALDISLPTTTETLLTEKFPFHWSKDKLTYLGIILTDKYKDWVRINYSTIIQEIKYDINMWANKTLSWFGRINTLKMNILPRLLYIFQSLPMKPPIEFFPTLNKLITKFVWNNKAPRIRRSTLQRTKLNGGTGLPNFQRYHQACVLQCLTDWTFYNHSKAWITIEQTYTTQPLKFLPWLSPDKRVILPDKHPLLTYALNIWDSLKHRHNLMSSKSLLTPLIHNPDFPPGLQKGYLAKWKHGTIFQIFQMCSKGILPGWDQVKRTFALTASDFLTYQQLRSFISPILKGITGDQIYTGFEDLCRQQQPPLHSISMIYQILLTQTAMPLSNLLHFIKWGKTLNKTFTEQELEVITTKSITGQRSCRILENNYKILTNWYNTPVKLCKIFPGVSDLCWRTIPWNNVTHILGMYRNTEILE